MHDGAAIASLLSTHRAEATPFLILDLAAAVRQLRRIEAALPGVGVWYALKCNPHPALAEALLRAGAGFEIASPGEVDALGRLGVPAGRMICMHTIKSAAFLRQLHATGVRVLAVDSTEEVEKVRLHAPGSELLVRVEVPTAGSRVLLSEKFGCTTEELPGILRSARRAGLRVRGVTTHLGSQCERLETFAEAVETLGRAIDAFAAQGLAIDWVSLGGGLPVEYTGAVPTLERIGAQVCAARERLTPRLAPGCRWTVEPGRAVAGPAGVMVTSVVGVATRQGVRWVYLDAGTHHGFFEWLPAAGGLNWPMAIEEPVGSRPRVPTRLAGPTCDGMDTLGGVQSLPRLEEGDRVAFAGAGAYSTSIGTQFNSFPPPRTVLESGGV